MMYSVEPRVVGRLHDVPRHFGMHDHAHARMLRAQMFSICRTVKRVWTEQWPFHRIIRARFDGLGLEAAPDLVRIPHDHLVERHAHLVGGVAAEMLIGQEQDRARRAPTPTSASPPRSTTCRRRRRARRQNALIAAAELM